MVEDLSFYEAILDNLTDGVYVLDDRGNYIFVNSAYVQALNMPKSVLLKYNVHDFLSTGQIDFCISDVVYREKRQIVMFQDVMDTQNYGRKTFRQMVISTPIFDETGKVRNILAVVRPLDVMNSLYYQASQTAAVSAFTGVGTTPPVTGSAVIAESPAMQAVLATAATVAAVDSAVLITGESGTGKEVVAQFIHDASPRKDRGLIVINCASLPENLLEAELFGYEKGAFTGAAPGGKVGLFEAADGGTLFLDEINSMPLNLQGKVLRALETKTIQRLGSTRSKKVDFRLLSASNEDLPRLVDEKRFRADLYYRLAVIPIRLPPLRDRREDIVPLALHFLDLYCRKYSKEKVFTSQTLRLIAQYPWPGNVRELKNFVERSVVMSMGRQIEVLDLTSFLDPVSPQSTPTPGPYSPGPGEPSAQVPYEQMLSEGVTLEDYLARCERDYLAFALQKCGSSYQAAAALGTSQSSIMRRKQKYGL